MQPSDRYGNRLRVRARQAAARCQSWEPGLLVRVFSLQQPASFFPDIRRPGTAPLDNTAVPFCRNHGALHIVISEPTSLLRVVPLLLWKWIQPLLSGIMPCPIVTSKSLFLSTLTEPLVEGGVTGELERLPPTPH